MNDLLASDSRGRRLSELPPLALYVHIPWCIRKCPYCDFNSHAAPEHLPEEAYVAALLADLERDLVDSSERPLSSIFIGGGTPSLFSAAALDLLLQGIRARVPWQPDLEITLEANPGTFEQAKFSAYRELGINRLSIGVQSFHDGHLQQLGRVHSGREAQRAVAIAQQAGFTAINLDLMHGLPTQTLEQALDDLHCAIALQPSHLSWYQLTIEPNTQFWSRPPVLPEDDSLWAIQEAGQALLAQAGFVQYEVSAYARAGQQAQHNLNYWTFGDYLGIGAGAHGKLSFADGRIQRYWKTRQPKDYLNPQRPQRAGEQLLTAAERPFEFVMNALRLIDGVPSALFTQRAGLPLTWLAAARALAERKGLLNTDPARLVTTAQGQLFLNDVLALFIEDADTNR